MSSAASLNMGQSQNRVLGNAPKIDPRGRLKVLKIFYIGENALETHHIFFSLKYNMHVLSIVEQAFPKQQILESSKLKVFSDNSFKFDENGRKFFE